MKERKGFVSNSSSSSFIIVGVQGKLAKELSKKDHAKVEWAGAGTGNTPGLEYVCYNEEDYNEETEECTFDIAGINAEKLLKEKHYNEIAADVKVMIEKLLGKTIKLSDIDLHVGETGNG